MPGETTRLLRHTPKEPGGKLHAGRVEVQGLTRLGDVPRESAFRSRCVSKRKLNECRDCADSKPRMSRRKSLGGRRPAVTATVQVAQFGKAGTNLAETAQEPLDGRSSPSGLRYVVR